MSARNERQLIPQLEAFPEIGPMAGIGLARPIGIFACVHVSVSTPGFQGGGGGWWETLARPPGEEGSGFRSRGYEQSSDFAVASAGRGARFRLTVLECGVSLLRDDDVLKHDIPSNLPATFSRCVTSLSSGDGSRRHSGDCGRQ